MRKTLTPSLLSLALVAGCTNRESLRDVNHVYEGTVIGESLISNNPEYGFAIKDDEGNVLSFSSNLLGEMTKLDAKINIGYNVKVFLKKAYEEHPHSSSRLYNHQVEILSTN